MIASKSSRCHSLKEAAEFQGKDGVHPYSLGEVVEEEQLTLKVIDYIISDFASHLELRHASSPWDKGTWC
jgi:hypothetical protein